jgi:xanthosine utilization system XapX-like protein
MHPLVGALSAAMMVGILSVILGRVPNPVVVAGIMLIGIGIGLVVARYGNVGPFQGEFGSPWFEARLSDTLRREVARAARFDRDLTIALVRTPAAGSFDWARQIREVDEAIACRGGWHVLVLPETTKDGAQTLIERVTLAAGIEVEAVIMDPSVTHSSRDRLSEALLELMRNPPVQTEAPLLVRRDTDRLRWPTG